MSRRSAKFVLGLFGWKVIGLVPDGIKKSIVIVAPHTSNWDFLVGYFAYKALDMDAKFLIKKEAFFFPLGSILRAMGAIPIDRSRSSNAVHQVGELFKKRDSLIVTITPEGTRKLVKNWKRGFYYIAEHAHVPVLIGVLDYGKKEIGIMHIFHITGNYEKDMSEIEQFYLDATAKYPENFNLSRQYRNKQP
jgi:1-acyl-sn-glycerol-3-phosphate acyltransferase